MKLQAQVQLARVRPTLARTGEFVVEKIFATAEPPRSPSSSRWSKKKPSDPENPTKEATGEAGADPDSTPVPEAKATEEPPWGANPVEVDIPMSKPQEADEKLGAAAAELNIPEVKAPSEGQEKTGDPTPHPNHAVWEQGEQANLR